MKFLNTPTFVLTIAACLTSCGFMTPAKQYAGDSLEPEYLAVIRSHVGNPFADEVHATISGFTKMEETGPGEQKAFGWPGFTDYPKEIAVLPGIYEVQIYCIKGFASYRPKITLKLRAGHNPYLTCHVNDGQAYVEVK